MRIQQRTIKRPLGEQSINPEIAGRYYQTRAIRRVCEVFEKDNKRKALLVMATGSGKTRTVIALCDVLMKANWVKRVLFLADRVALVNQAVKAFKEHSPSCPVVDVLKDREGHGRVYVSTYPTMMGLIDDVRKGVRRFGPGHFDLIVVDEAHRSVYRKYKAIFEYFDSALVGLTATPKKDIDHDTYSLFALDQGDATDEYSLDQAVADGFLVPAKVFELKTKVLQRGLKYDELSEEEKAQWDAIDWDEEGNTPDKVEPAAINKWLFNKKTVDKVIYHLMTNGIKVDNGDKLGKTIIFAKNQPHADFIAERFNENYPQYNGNFARVIHNKIEYAQSLIDAFSSSNKMPQIAISVDMLDTGVDVPEVVNLVFFKLLRSPTKFRQMIGRGTRLSEDLFGPGKDKTHFKIFDFGGNFSFFNQTPEKADPGGTASLTERLFTRRVELVGTLDELLKTASQPEWPEVKAAFTGDLQHYVAEMSMDNFMVRLKRRLVKKYQTPEIWKNLGPTERTELVEELAGLPSTVRDDDIAAKQFDYLVFSAELALLRKEKVFKKLQKQIRSLASLLEEISNIPAVNAELSLILDIQTDEFWQDITLPMLEDVRKRIRPLIKLVELKKRPPIYTDFDDELEEITEIEFLDLTNGSDLYQFRQRVRQFLSQHANHLSIQKGPLK